MANQNIKSHAHRSFTRQPLWPSITSDMYVSAQKWI